MTGPALQPTLDRPQLTLPPDEADWLRSCYGSAARILEYGSGGSTVLAGEMDGKTVWSVESDRTWAEQMKAWFAQHPPRGKVNLHHVDIGPTGRWGYPTNNSAWRNYPRYPLSVWDAPGFEQPDLVLIDRALSHRLFPGRSDAQRQPGDGAVRRLHGSPGLSRG